MSAQLDAAYILDTASKIEQTLLEQVSDDYSGQPVLVVAAEHKDACCVVVFRWNLHDLVHVPQTTVLTKRAVERIRRRAVPVFEADFVGDVPLIRRASVA